MWIQVMGWVYMFVGSFILSWHAADTRMTSQATADCKRNCGYECVQDDNSLQPAGYRQAERRDRATMPGARCAPAAACCPHLPVIGSAFVSFCRMHDGYLPPTQYVLLYTCAHTIISLHSRTTAEKSVLSSVKHACMLNVSPHPGNYHTVCMYGRTYVGRWLIIGNHAFTCVLGIGYCVLAGPQRQILDGRACLRGHMTRSHLVSHALVAELPENAVLLVSLSSHHFYQLRIACTRSRSESVHCTHIAFDI